MMYHLRHHPGSGGQANGDTMTTNGDFIRGKMAICQAVQRSWKVVRKWIAHEGFPAVKIDGVWESHRKLIDDWRLRKIASWRQSNAVR